MAYEYICDGGLDPVVPARVLGGVSIGVVSRTVGDAGSFAGRSLEEELADSVFLTVPRLEEEEAASPRLKMLSESTANSQPCCSSALWQCTVLPRGLWIVGMLATANYWGRCRARLILCFEQSRRSRRRCKSERLQTWVPEFGGYGSAQNTAMEVATESLQFPEGCRRRGQRR